MNSQNTLSSLQIIFFALLLGQVMFLAVAFFLVQQGAMEINPEDNADIGNILKIIVPTLALGGLLGGNVIFRNFMKTAREKSALHEKMGIYRTAFIIKSALLEAPVLLSIVAYLLSADIIFPVIAVILIALFVLMRPTTSAVSNDLNLSAEESDTL